MSSMADEVRFELTMGSHPRRFSRPVHSTALPLIRTMNNPNWIDYIHLGLAESEMTIIAGAPGVKGEVAQHLTFSEI